MRTCVVCRRQRDDREMVRFGRSPDGAWYVGRGHGRGVWLCLDGSCGHDVGAGHLARALRVKVVDGDVALLRDAVARVSFK